MFRNYLKIAFRNMVRQKTFAIINLGGLALSLAAVWVIALFVMDEWSYDKYHLKAERIFRVVSHGHWGEEKFDVTGTSGLAAATFKKDFPEVEEAVRIDREGGGVMNYGDKTIKEDAVFLTDPSFFSVFTYRFLAGTANALRQPNTIVLTKTFAAKFFPNPQDALNKVIYVDKAPNVVTGVIEDVPSQSHFSFNALRPFPENYQSDWSNISIYTYLLLKQNADINSLRLKMPAFVTKYLTQNANDINYNLELQPVTSIHLHSHLAYELGENHDIKYVYVLSVVGLLILIIALINYINITTARAAVRLREVAVRKISGSSRTSLVSLFLTESIITILSAAIISVFLVSLAMPVFNYLTGKQLSIWQFGIATSILSLLTFSLVAGLIGGLYPAFFLSRFQPIPALKNQLGDVKGQSLFRKSLVMFQFAVTVVMIAASFIIYLQLKYVRNKDLGFNKNQMLTFHIDTRSVREKVPAIRTALLQNPMIKAVASAGNPIGNNDIGMMDYSVEKNGVLDEHSNLAYGLTVDADFIPAMQIKVLEGRNFSNDFSSDSNDVVVNEAFLKRQGWTTGIGKRISRGKDSTGKVFFANIIGVVKDYHIYSLQHIIDPIVMQLPKKATDRDNMYVRVDERNLSQSLAFIENTYKKFDAAATFNYSFLDKNFSTQYQAEQRQGEVLLAFTILTISIASLGLFGLITFTVGQRVKEIGIRKTLGASVTSLVSLLTGSLLKVVLMAMFVAIPLSWLAMNKWLQDFAYRITLQWWMFVLAGAIAGIVAIITVSFQAIKAAIANPVKSLRTE
ncbi:ABC transporter permease [Segetibacter aerophilus]|uniref:ABC transporter permease n=1 Tax=Segetibacter aerophilus TaxID=670293 RepID=A0A512BB59_9BACT|nr:ABC transporter permease [Segetibacter aerophilus]GEO09214.1 ABC transporter permease [Segetibacter aerophilus]